MKKRVCRLLFIVLSAVILFALLSVSAGAADTGAATVSFNGETVSFGTFAQAWSYAVNRDSSVTGYATVKLLADVGTSYGNGFGTGYGFGDGTPSGGGCLYVPEDKYISIDLNGFALNRGQSYAVNSGCVISVGGSFVLSDGSASKTGRVTGGNNNGAGVFQGGGIYVCDGGSFTMSGGTVTSNKSVNGGGVYVCGDFIMRNGYITGNTSSGSGGGVYMKSGVFDMMDKASVSQNIASVSGGGIYIKNGVFVMHGSSLKNNYAGDAGNLCIDENATFVMVGGNISGSNGDYGIKISSTGVTFGGTIEIADWVYLKKDAYIKVDEATLFLPTVKIRTEEVPGKLKIAEGSAETGKFTVQSGYTTVKEGKNLYVMSYPKATVTVNGEITHYSDFGKAWEYAAEARDSAGAAVVKLLDNVQTEMLTVPSGANIVLDLNDYILDRGMSQSAATIDGVIFTVAGRLTVKCSARENGKLGKITGANPSENGSITVSYGGTFVLEGGAISGNISDTACSGVYIAGTFIMSGGEITDNKGNSCGGVYFAEGMMNISGSIKITRNTVNRSTASNLRVAPGMKVSIAGSISADSVIGVFAPSGTPSSSEITYKSNINHSTCFTSDSSEYTVVGKEASGRYYACLSAIYTVSFNANKGISGSMTYLRAVYGSDMPSLTGAGMLPTRQGWSFTGYYDAESGGVKYYNADGTSAHVMDKTVPFTLYAAWAINSYRITVINGQGGGTFAEGTHVTITAMNPPAGKAFAKWQSITGVEFTEGTTETNEKAVIIMPSENITITALFGHQHNWSSVWRTDGSFHWHECTEGDCPEMNNTEKGGYGAHVYDNDCDISCNICGATRQIQGHVYDNACDTTCNTCGAVRVASPHVYSGDCDTDCNVCGEKREAKAHTYSHPCDSTCNVCGYKRDDANAHTYDNSCDDICNVCGERRDVSLHVYDNACDPTCNVCGATRTVSPHVYDNACDPMCNICGATRAVTPHVYDNACDDTCNICGAKCTVKGHVYDNACDADCNVCGDIRTPSAHVYSGVCDSVCDVCKARRNTGIPHTYNDEFDDTCDVCGAVRVLDKYLKDEIERVRTAVESYKADEVGNSDIKDIEKLIEDIEKLSNSNSLTDEQRALLDELKDKCDELIKSIKEIITDVGEGDTGTELIHDGVLSGEVSLRVTTVPAGTLKDVNIKKNTGYNREIVSAYKIELLVDGEISELKETVTIRLPIPEYISEDENIVVVSVDGNDKATDMHAVRKGNHVEFVTDKLGVFAFAGEKSGSQTILIIVAASIVLLVVGFWVFWFLYGKRKKSLPPV